MWRLYGILSHVDQTLHVVCLRVAQSLCAAPAPSLLLRNENLRLCSSSDGELKMLDCSIRFCVCEGPGTPPVGTMVGGLPLYSFCFFDFSSRKFLLPTSNIRPSCSGFSTSLVSGVAVSWSEPSRGHLGGEGGKKNRNRWWRFSPF